MYGGLLKSASAVAIFAAAGLYGASPAKAADLVEIAAQTSRSA